MDQVRASAAWVANNSSHVLVDPSGTVFHLFLFRVSISSGFIMSRAREGIEKVVEDIKDCIPKVEWDFEGIHYFDDGPLTVQYLLVLDALNFCFWPGPSYLLPPFLYLFK